MDRQIFEPELITIDQKWVCKESFLKYELITCPVCYCIPIDYPRECEKCERIFCRGDYEIIARGNNRCPNCKSEPWQIKKDVHITYKHLFDSLVLKCIICPVKKEYNRKDLIYHLEHVHDRFLSEESILFDYFFVSEKGEEIKLNLTQNIQINYKRNEGMSKFQIAGASGRVLNVDLKDMTASHQQLGKCRILKQRSKSIKKNYQYLLWIVNISDPEEAEERIVFFSEELQGIIEKNYQDYERNQRLNEFCLDVREARYRISFSSRTQTNTYTKAEKTVVRLPVIFR